MIDLDTTTRSRAWCNFSNYFWSLGAYQDLPRIFRMLSHNHWISFDLPQCEISRTSSDQTQAAIDCRDNQSFGSSRRWRGESFRASQSKAHELERARVREEKHWHVDRESPSSDLYQSSRAPTERASPKSIRMASKLAPWALVRHPQVGIEGLPLRKWRLGLQLQSRIHPNEKVDARRLQCRTQQLRLSRGRS